MNRLLSLRQDLTWRKKTVEQMRFLNRIILDIATGTGDLAIEAANFHPVVRAIGLNLSRIWLTMVQKIKKN